jgi:ribonuclease toxin BrnT of type II toxin-antitoxin system
MNGGDGISHPLPGKKDSNVYTADSRRFCMHNCVYTYQDMQLDWDDEKNGANLAKHGVSFELASYVFDDPLHRSVLDPCESSGSRRIL